MAVKVNILTHNVEDNSPEYEAAKELKDILDACFAKYPQAKGDVRIGYSLTLSGQKVRDIDLLLFGEVSGCVLKSAYASPTDKSKMDVSVESFCYVIELKDHSSDKVKSEDTHLWVNYKGSWKDVSDQSEAQKYSFMKYFAKANDYTPFVCNVIWLRQIKRESLSKILVKGNVLNALPATFTLSDLILQNISQLNTDKFKPYGGMYHINVNADGSFLNGMNEILKERRAPGGLTRKKLELLTKSTIEKGMNKVEDSEKLTILSGRAGTGKTFFLLQTALRLASEEGHRCLLLTYNQALVSDIRRLLHYIGVPDKVDSYTVQVQPLHDFFIRLMKLLTDEYPTDKSEPFKYINKYKSCINKLSAYINECLNENDIKYLKDVEQTSIDWDYILVDEAQDWSDGEKNIIMKIYGPEHIIVADGIDQFIRSGVKQHWERSVPTNAINKTVGLRQKSNLTSFVNAFAKACGLNWEVKVNKDILGGNVRIISKYDAEEHKRIVNNCRKNECDNYDILFLTPPRLISHEGNERHFKDLDYYESIGVKLFDGTNDKLRDQYSTSVDECRIYQYDSSRGLEGWCTICLEFDELIDYKMNTYHDNEEQSLLLESMEDRMKRYVYLWSLIPLTRPMDTLVITLNDPDSEVGKILKTIADSHKDFVEWDVSPSGMN